VTGKEAVIDYQSLIYRPSGKLQFEDNPETGKRLPLYIWKPRLLIYQRKYFKYNSSMLALGYLILNNPCIANPLKGSLHDLSGSPTNHVLHGGIK
jgi:hypothetical protein